MLVVILLIASLINSFSCEEVLSGPGLHPDKIVMPARYFYVNFTAGNYHNAKTSELAVEISGTSKQSSHCRLWINKLDRKDGTAIVRYKMYDTCSDVYINVMYQNKHLGKSPLRIAGTIIADQCYCPEKDINLWLNDYECPKFYKQIDNDLKAFSKINMETTLPKIKEKYHRPESTSFCHYVVKNNQVYRDCYGKHVGFNMFSDEILLSLTRKVTLPDLEFVMNLGDWPLVKKGYEPLPIFSWCGSDDTMDVVVPTYDLTESALQNMGRVTLDTLSVQGSLELAWSERESRAIWRGRDSRAERLTLVDIARKYPDLINASLTNFFFFREKEAEYGPKQPHISFFKFFDYKYQISIDGTVAAYRLPYLLAGGGLVLKQDSPYYEHFYHSLEPWEHFVPVKRDLSDLVEKVKWAREHDDRARQIAQNARSFANEHLLPQHVLCYHAILLKEWSKRLENEVRVREGMTPVPQTSKPCECNSLHKDEL